MKAILIIIAAFVVIISAFIYLNKPQTPQITSQTTTPTPFSEEKVNIKATFTIITDNITRNFEAEKYHNLSPDVYITADESTIIRVKKTGITWDDFFKTLPMKLSYDCLVTGDGETLCNGSGGTLKFYLNDVEDKDLLDKEIKEDAKALIRFTPS
ncbi:MAG: hypothetical protein Q7R49_02515 [Candidatus Daviesbacteria bacterium]|nr:hypothetical protein [Candidatus Daviesbacteria bacterium]